MPAIDALVCPRGSCHLPLSGTIPATRIAIRSTRSRCDRTRPGCPSKLEFIGRINGLDSGRRARIVFAASYLVLGLGRVPPARRREPR